MNPETLKYLKQDEIGKVIAKGLASVYTRKPEKPVEYLVNWLRNYSNTQKQMSKVLQSRTICQNSLHTFQENEKVNAIRVEQEAKEERAKKQQVEKFKATIKQHDYLREMLEEEFPEFIEHFIGATGVYIGELNYPFKIVTEEDTDEQAHYNTEAEKLINYIGSSVSHKDLMRGNTLAVNLGVTHKAFSLNDQAPPAEEGQQQIAAPKQKFVYIPNVVKNEAVHYFKIPKLGAYLAVPLIYESHLTQKIFDDALAAKNKYFSELQEFQSKKQEDIDHMKTEVEELVKKISDLKDKNSDPTQLQQLETELSELEQSLSQKQAEKLQEGEPELVLEKQSYVVCVDNLGKDQQLSESHINFIVDMVEHFTECWSTKQKMLLKNDVDTHVKLIKQLPETPQALHEGLNKSLEQMDEEITQELAECENQTTKAYKQEEWEYRKLKTQIKENPVYLQSFKRLQQFRVVKYRDILQNLLYFLGYSKKDINIPGQAGLFWKQVKQKYITEHNFMTVLDYVAQGPKEGQFHPYAKTPVLLEKCKLYGILVQNCDEQQIFAYNVGLGAIVKFIKAALRHRKSNFELRKSQKETLQQQRDQIIAQNEKIAEEKTAALEKQKTENAEEFNEEQWSQKYDEEHPLKQVPAEIMQDIDNDMQ